MGYKVALFEQGQRKSESGMDGYSLSYIKEHARKQFETGLGYCIEVRDENDTFVFQWPRTVRNAQGS